MYWKLDMRTMDDDGGGGGGSGNVLWFNVNLKAGWRLA